MIHATLCFVFRDEPQPGILLGYKKRGFGQGKFDGFGGKLYEGESLPQAAVRELQEESGISAEQIDLNSLGSLTFIFPYKPEWSQIVHVYIAEKWQGTPTESEEMRPQWFDLTDLPFQHMWDDAHYWLSHVLLRQPIEATLVLNQDNETVKEHSIRLL